MRRLSGAALRPRKPCRPSMHACTSLAAGPALLAAGSRMRRAAAGPPACLSHCMQLEQMRCMNYATTLSCVCVGGGGCSPGPCRVTHLLFGTPARMRCPCRCTAQSTQARTASSAGQQRQHSMFGTHGVKVRSRGVRSSQHVWGQPLAVQCKEMVGGGQSCNS